MLPATVVGGYRLIDSDDTTTAERSNGSGFHSAAELDRTAIGPVRVTGVFGLTSTTS
jgi:hypothetical protein